MITSINEWKQFKLNEAKSQKPINLDNLKSNIITLIDKQLNVLSGNTGDDNDLFKYQTLLYTFKKKLEGREY